MAKKSTYVLPALMVSPGDIHRVRREVEAVDEFLHQSSLRQGGNPVKLPVTSRLLDALVEANDLNLLQKTDRDSLVEFLTNLVEAAPVLHISFASNPSSAFTNKLTVWLRSNIHPLTLVRVGLQPAIGVGCILRTSNHEYDLSLARKFDGQKPKLFEALRKLEVQSE